MRTIAIVAGSTVFSAMATIPATTAHADNLYQFQSPTGNITCVMAALAGTSPHVSCEIDDHTWLAPPRPPVCLGAWGDRIDMNQGDAAALSCHTDTTRGSGLPTLQYGDSRSLASITCASERSGITCTDTNTGHFFRISRESYEPH